MQNATFKIKNTNIPTVTRAQARESHDGNNHLNGAMADKREEASSKC
jgi:hypothetical protein